MIIREPIYGALWNTVSTAVAANTNLSVPFFTIQRRLRHWSQVPPSEQPAIFMSETGGYAGHMGGTRIDYVTNAPVVWTLFADFYVYFYETNELVAPGIDLNPLIDAVELALKPDWTGFLDLGIPDQVRHARLQGKLQTDEGTLGQQAIAIIPIEIFCV